jgi:hypothetical protein
MDDDGLADLIYEHAVAGSVVVLDHLGLIRPATASDPFRLGDINVGDGRNFHPEGSGPAHDVVRLRYRPVPIGVDVFRPTAARSRSRSFSVGNRSFAPVGSRDCS